MTEEAVRNRSNELGVSLAETLRRSDISTVGLELAELALDSTMSEGILRDVPVLGALTGLWRTGRTVRDFLFTKKLVAFLRTLVDVPAEQRSEMIDRLEADRQFRRKVGEEIVLLLDRLDSMAKAVLMGRAFRGYCLGAFDALTLERLNHAIDRILERDLRRLPEFVANEQAMDDMTTQSFVNAGLAYMPVGMASTAVRANRELCAAMIVHVLGETNAG